MIKNQTKGTFLAMEYSWCGSILSRMRGLMFRRAPKALIMAFPKEQKIGLHMMFVFFPIDVLWLDAEQKVVEMREGFRPWTTASPAALAQYAVELPAGSIKAADTSLGDQIVWAKV
jgi:uncharacterized membrane protein (UPF0127 family)